MNSTEATHAQKRLERFSELAILRIRLVNLIRQLDETPAGFADSPFTGNTRESRTVTRLEIQFSPTNGGERGITVILANPGICACDLGGFLETRLLE